MDLNQILGNLGFDWRMAVANLVNFLIIFWLLKRYAWQPIKKTLHQRQEKIDQGLEDARKAATELQMAKQNRDKILMQAHQEANQIVSQANQQAEKIINSSKQTAQEEAQKIVAQAKETIAQQKESMLSQIKQDVIELIISTSEKFMTKKIDAKQEEEIIKQLISKS